jgi:hypothetical protein
MPRRPKPESGLRPGEVMVTRSGVSVPAPKAFADMLTPEHDLPCIARIPEVRYRCANYEDLLRALKTAGHPVDVWRAPEFERQHGALWLLSSEHPSGSQVVGLATSLEKLVNGKFLVLTEVFGLSPAMRITMVPKSSKARLISAVERINRKLRGLRRGRKK